MSKNILISALNATAKDLSPTFFLLLSLYFFTSEQSVEYAGASLAMGLLLGVGKYLSRYQDLRREEVKALKKTKKGKK